MHIACAKHDRSGNFSVCPYEHLAPLKQQTIIQVFKLEFQGKMPSETESIQHCSHGLRQLDRGRENLKNTSHFHISIREPVPKTHAREAKERTCTLTTYWRRDFRGYKPRVVKSTSSCLISSQSTQSHFSI